MHADMKKATDKLVHDTYLKLNNFEEGKPQEKETIPQAFLAAIVNAQMVVVKLSVLGSAVSYDNKDKIDVKDTCRKIGEDVTALIFNMGEACNIPIETVAEALGQLSKGMAPLIEHFYGAAISRIQIN